MSTWKLVLICLANLMIGFFVGGRVISRMTEMQADKVPALSYATALNPMDDLAELLLISEKRNDEANKFLVASLSRRVDRLVQLAESPGPGSEVAKDFLALIFKFKRDYPALKAVEGFEKAVSKIDPKYDRRT